MLIAAAAALLGLAACEKESSTDLSPKESSLKFSLTVPSSSTVNATPFTISYAGISNEYLYLGLTYTGGELGHKFSVTWDGTVTNKDEKKIIELQIFHNNTTDNGTQQITDSLSLSLKSLNIPAELRTNENLYYKVVNSTKPDNAFLVKEYISPINPNNDNGNNNTYSTTDVMVKVIQNDNCAAGTWNTLWLKENNSERYLLPLSVADGITYSATANDILKISFERTHFADSSSYCDSWANKWVEVINITKLEKAE